MRNTGARNCTIQQELKWKLSKWHWMLYNGIWTLITYCSCTLSYSWMLSRIHSPPVPNRKRIVAKFPSCFDVLDVAMTESLPCTVSASFRMLHVLCSDQLTAWVWLVTIPKRRTDFESGNSTVLPKEHLINHFWVVWPVMQMSWINNDFSNLKMYL